MRKAIVAGALTGAALLMAPAAAFAQVWTPGAEIIGQSVQVETNGVVNTVHFDPGGMARIVSPGGNVVQGSWTAANGQICLMAAGATECWPYTQAFMAGQAVQLTSTCQSLSTWMPQGTNPPPMPAAEGERG